VYLEFRALVFRGMLDQTILHYRITQKLGAGGMGVVYKAVDLQLERTVALKFLSHHMCFSRADKENLLREARAASALDHPNIGVIHSVEEADDHQLFMVMGYYEGETLLQKMTRGALSVRESLDLAIQVARGLGAAHARNIVHRDIKPSNIIVTPDGVAKIVDFGLARVVASASASATQTTAAGSLPYMAPEQILGENVSQLCDVWALGVITVQMLTGSHPFLRPNIAAMSFAILNQPPEALNVVPTTLRPVLYRALSKQPSKRYANAGEMLKDLELVRAEIASAPAPLEGPTLTSTGDPRKVKRYVENASTPQWTTASPKRSHRLLLAALALMLVAAVAFSFPHVRANLFEFVYAGTEKHVAVLPFENATKDRDSELIASGLMDSMTNELSNLEAAQQSLWVVPSSVVRNRNVNDPSAAFRELGATMVVQGRVSRVGRNVSLTVNLIDSKRLRQIGSAQFEDADGDLATVQSEAVLRLAYLMKVSASTPTLTPARSVSPNSYESYLKALGYMQRYDKRGNLDQAISELNTAIARDPRFALGHATLGEAYRLKFETDHHPEWVERAFTSCRTAVEIDNRLPAAHVTLGHLNATLGKNDAALQEFQRALDIKASDADALIGIAGVYEQMGRPADAEANYRRAIAFRPDYWGGFSALGDFYDRQGRIVDSIAQYRHIIELTPDNTAAYNNLGIEYMELNDAASSAAAEAAFRKSIELAANYQAYADLGWLYLGQKRYAESAAATRKALELNDRDWRVWANLVVAYEWLKDTEKKAVAHAKARSLLEQYASLNPQDAQVQSVLSTYYAEDNLRDSAVARANRALDLAPTNPAVLADVAETYDGLGDRKRALQCAEDSLKHGYTLSDLRRRPGLVGVLADPSFRHDGKP
jgi:serine/threonine protein kinase/tetratricopeptide (TPR) repeat protein